MGVFLINPQVVSFFLNTDTDDPQVEKFLDQYSLNVDKIFDKTALEFLGNKGILVDTIQKALEISQLQKKGEDPEVVDTDVKNALSILEEGEFGSLFIQSVNKYNRKIYGMYTNSWDQERRDEFNRYIFLAQTDFQSEMEGFREGMEKAISEIEEQYVSQQASSTSDINQLNSVSDLLPSVEGSEDIDVDSGSSDLSFQSQPPSLESQIPDPKSQTQNPQIPNSEFQTLNLQTQSSQSQIPQQQSAQSIPDTSEATLEQESRPVEPPPPAQVQTQPAQQQSFQPSPQAPVTESPNMQSL